MASNATRIANRLIELAGEVEGVAAAYWNEAPDLPPGDTYITFAFRDPFAVVAFEGVSENYLTVEYYLYAKTAAMAADAEELFVEALRRNLVTKAGLETGVTTAGYHFARRRVVLTAATRG